MNGTTLTLTKRYLFCFLSLIHIASMLKAQDMQSLVPQIPTSPQAEAFKLYGDYAINYSNGTPDISVPLYEINHRGFKLPLSLKYNAQPLRQGYNYDVFGAGWGLSISSSISRTVEYVPDEARDFNLDLPSTNQYLPYCALCLKDYNYARDKFNAVLPDGSSFDFFIENVNNVPKAVVSNRQMVVNVAASNAQIHWFTVLDGKGIKYTFSPADFTYSGPYTTYGNVYVSWQLTRIDLPNSTDPILFSYDYLIQPPSGTCAEPSVTISHSYVHDSYANNFVDTKTATRGTNYVPHYYKMKLLSQISYGTSGDNVIQFSYQNASGAQYNYIDKIKVFEKNALLREIELELDVQTLTNSCNSTQRGRLDQILIKGADALTVQKYECTYESAYGLNGTDHWGYLTQYPSDMPNFSIFTEWNLAATGHTYSAAMFTAARTSLDVNSFYKFKFSNYPVNARQPSGPDHHGILKKIKYPTGGYTEFVYENHKFLSSTDTNGDYIPDGQPKTPTAAAGFRIKTITNYATDGIIAGQKHYRYGKTNHEYYGASYAGNNAYTGLGIAVVDPNVLTYMNFAERVNFFSVKNLVVGLDGYGQRTAFLNPYENNPYSEWAYESTFSPANFQRLLDGRQPVVYAEVTEFEGPLDEYANVYPNGKTIYRYDLGENEYPGGFFEPLMYYGNRLGAESKKYKYNRLKEKADYTFDTQLQEFKLIKKQQNKWSEYVASSIDFQFMNLHPVAYTPQYFTVASLFTNKYQLIGQATLSSQVTTEYMPTGETSSTIEEFKYNNREQLSAKRIKTNDYKWMDETYIYPGFSANVGTSVVEQDMMTKNIISPIIEKHTTVVDSAMQTQTFVRSVKTDFAKFGAAQTILPSKMYELEVTPTGSQYVTRNEITKYSVNGNPQEVLARNAVKTAYLWGYDDRYMIAEVRNASQNEVFLANFEALGEWDGGLTTYDSATKRTGKASGRIDKPDAGEQVSHSNTWLNISLAGTKKFRYSGWIYSNGPSAQIFLFMKRTGETGYFSYIDNVSTDVTGKWIYLEKEFEVPADVVQLGIRVDNNGGGSVWFDDIRLHPAEALMSSYTYDPLVGVTSQSDANGRPSIYEYDSFQRLKVVRDQNGDIVKSYCYNYAGQLTDCNGYNTSVAPTASSH